VQVLFATHYVAAKLVLQAVPPRSWAAIRVSGAALLLLGAVRLAGARLPRGRDLLPRFALFALLGVVINQICFVEGLSRTTTSHSAIINTSIPVATLLIAILMGQERATGRKLAGIALSLGGVLYLIAHSGAVLGGEIAFGDLLNVANALSYSFFLVISKPILSRHSSLAVTAWLLSFGALGISAIGAPQLATVDPGALPASVWWTGLFVILFPTVGAYILNAWALKRVESSIVALFIYMQPLIAAATGLLVLGESLGVETFISAAFIFSGVAVALRRARGPTESAAAG
jgi:drug/metabolite transporter (DMT)-like permease